MGRVSRRTALALLAVIIVLGGLARFYRLDWGTPYYHFHIDEHFVFVGALEIRKDFFAAAESPKFFMYSPLPMYLLIGLMEVYETIRGPFDLALKGHATEFMVLGRAISATLGTATIPLVYLIAARGAGRAAGVLAALLLAAGVLHVRDSHFFSVDVSLTFFSVLTWLLLVRLVQERRTWLYVASGLAIGGAMLCKYTGVFLVPIAGVAHLCAAGWPGRDGTRREWTRWLLLGTLPGIVAAITFLALDPLLLLEFDKFRSDVHELITGPMSGELKPIWAAQFTNIRPWLFWFTNVLWWGAGPALEIWGLAGVLWLLWRRDATALTIAAFPIIYYFVAGRSGTPYARYGVPLIPALAVTAAVFSADLFARARWRRLSVAGTAVVVIMTVGYAAAYMNIFIRPDSRLEASQFLMRNVAPGSRILVEPSHNIPPLGRYLTQPNWHVDYVMWGPEARRDDYFELYGLDTYRYLYDPRVPADEKRAYIARRLALADYIVMDDTFVQFYEALPAAEHGVVKQYYDDLFAGRLGFQLVRTFKTYPALGGLTIDDDAAELSFRLFDHPRVFVFKRGG